MTAANAIKKMSKLGEVRVSESGRQLSVRFNGHILRVHVQDGHTLKMWHTERIGEFSDPQSDYFPGSWWSSFNSAVKYGLN